MEAVLGAVHVDSDFSEGRKATLQILDPILGYLKEVQGEQKDVSVKHPKKVLQEMGGEILELLSAEESDFALQQLQSAGEDNDEENNSSSSCTTTKVWFGKYMDVADKEGSNYIASIELLGTCILALADVSPIVARNRVCAMMVAFLERNPDILSRFKACRYNVESNMFQQAAMMKSKKLREETTYNDDDGGGDYYDDDDDMELIG